MGFRIQECQPSALAPRLEGGSSQHQLAPSRPSAPASPAALQIQHCRSRSAGGDRHGMCQRPWLLLLPGPGPLCFLMAFEIAMQCGALCDERPATASRLEWRRTVTTVDRLVVVSRPSPRPTRPCSRVLSIMHNLITLLHFFFSSSVGIVARQLCMKKAGRQVCASASCAAIIAAADALLCARCKLVSYCGRSCQKAD
jgi:hypothetical protein